MTDYPKGSVVTLPMPTTLAPPDERRAIHERVTAAMLEPQVDWKERAERAEARVAELEAAICRHVRAREGESNERPDMTVAVLYRIERAIKARNAGQSATASVSDGQKKETP